MGGGGREGGGERVYERESVKVLERGLARALFATASPTTRKICDC